MAHIAPAVFAAALAAVSVAADALDPHAAVPTDDGGTIVLDFRDDTMPDTATLGDDDQQAAIIDSALGDAAPPTAIVTSPIEGTFTAPGRNQTAVIVVPDGPGTINPHPTPSTLAIMEGGEVVARHAFAIADSGWQWLRAAVDSDGDGIDELLATASWFQMGETGTALLHASMAEGAFRRLDVIEQVHISNCALPSAQPDQRKAIARIVRVGDGGLTTETYEARCPGVGPGESRREPAPADFRPVQLPAGGVKD